MKHLIENEEDYYVFLDLLKSDIGFSDLELHNNYTEEQFQEISKIVLQIKKWNYIVKTKNQLIHRTKQKLLSKLDRAVQYNVSHPFKKRIRKVSQNAIIDKNIISVFDSSLTRMLNIQENTLSDSIMVIKVFYFDIIKDLIQNGYTYKGEKYRFFTSSAGQIRTKKTVFIKESLWNQYEKTLMCGLTVDEINKKGGINVNKYLAYLALSNSATDEWKDFDITKSIVVDDFETLVSGLVDYIDYNDYSIIRKLMDVPIAHTDGCGMVLDTVSSKNFMIRLPWVKGLLGSFPFRTFIEEANQKNPEFNHGLVTDIYGNTHDIFEEDIKIIFTKSQFKMHKYYKNWTEYVNSFIKYNCQAGICNVEEDYIKNAKINYQMVQTLNDMTDAELELLAEHSIKKIDDMSSDVKTMLDVFGANKYNTHKTPLQKALVIYPELLNDVYTKDVIREIKKSLIKNYKAAKLEIRGKYTFILPDLYAFCEYLFLGDKSPKGLLKDGEVSCKLYPKIDKLDCLRSPHLFREHSVRQNIISDETKKWFNTNALYTSCHDLISKVLQFDVDGDKSLVVSERNFVAVAERHMKDIVPLYYEMKKADPVQLSGDKIYDGLNAAYTGGNIGAISNDISKIWNSECVDDNALKAIKLLCMENNFVIDYAKTLYKPTRPKDINILIKGYTQAKVPYFFIYAKDKELNQVEPINKSIVNKLDGLIQDKRLRFTVKDFGKLDYKMLMNNSDIKIHNELLKEYSKLNRQYHYKVNMEDGESDNKKYIAQDIRERLSVFGYSDIDIADMLVKHLYKIKHSKSKESLWFCYGGIIVDNLKRNIGNKTEVCHKCGKRFEKVSNNQIYCEGCAPDVEYQNYQPLGTKIIKCIDCGEDVEVDACDMKTKRCKFHQHEEDKRVKREYWKKKNKKLEPSF